MGQKALQGAPQASCQLQGRAVLSPLGQSSRGPARFPRVEPRPWLGPSWLLASGVSELEVAEVGSAVKPTKGPPSSTLGLVNHQGFGGGANIIMTQQETYRPRGRQPRNILSRGRGQGCQVILDTGRSLGWVLSVHRPCGPCAPGGKPEAPAVSQSCPSGLPVLALSLGSIPFHIPWREVTLAWPRSYQIKKDMICQAQGSSPLAGL